MKKRYLPAGKPAMGLLPLSFMLLLGFAAKLSAQCSKSIDTIRVTAHPSGILIPDAEGRTFERYTNYKLPGIPFANGNAIANTNTGAPNGTSSQALYQRGLYSQSMDMHFAVPNGSYTILLHYCDNGVAPGGRIFDVFIENTLVDDDLDVRTVAGASHRALVRSHNVTVDGNDLHLLFIAEKENAILSGIEIIPNGFSSVTQSLAMDLDVTGCYYAGGSSKATVRVGVSWENAVPNDVITIALGAQTRKIYPGMIAVSYAGGWSGVQSIVAPQDVAFEIPADGASGTITATYDNNPSCTISIPYTAPAACPPSICTASAGIVGGHAFIDNNRDGIEQGGKYCVSRALPFGFMAAMWTITAP
jgi:Malectin domain